MKKVLAACLLIAVLLFVSCSFKSHPSEVASLAKELTPEQQGTDKVASEYYELAEANFHFGNYERAGDNYMIAGDIWIKAGLDQWARDAYYSAGESYLKAAEKAKAYKKLDLFLTFKILSDQAFQRSGKTEQQ